MTRVLLLPQQIGAGQFSGGSFLRVIGPSKQISSSDKSIRFDVRENDDGEAYDLAVIERFWMDSPDLKATYALVAGLKRRNIPIVHTIDDNLYELFQETAIEPNTLERLLVTSFLTRSADGVIVSTPALAELVRQINPVVHIFPNYIARRFVSDLKSRTEPAVRVGYMGTFTHLEDLRAILNPLKAALHDEPALRFEIIGVGEAATIRTLLSPHPVKLLSVPDHTYEAFFDWFSRDVRWDIGLAPLTETAINRSKSDIKALDYAAAGTAAIVSDVPAYSYQKRHGTARVVANDPDSWYTALRELARDSSGRHTLAAQARQDIVSNRLLEGNAGAWWQAVKLCAEQKNVRSV